MAIGKQLSDLNPDGTAIGQTAADKVSFYGATPVAQRAASIQANSVVSISSNITIAASLTAWIVEVTATLNALWEFGKAHSVTSEQESCILHAIANRPDCPVHQGFGGFHSLDRGGGLAAWLRTASCLPLHQCRTRQHDPRSARR
jgi:hypothetical protein